MDMEVSHAASKKLAVSLVACFVHFSVLEIEAGCFSKTLVEFCQTTRRHSPEDSTLHNTDCWFKFCFKLAMEAHGLVRRHGSNIF
jgi:hypothetical protein